MISYVCGMLIQSSMMVVKLFFGLTEEGCEALETPFGRKLVGTNRARIICT